MASKKFTDEEFFVRKAAAAAIKKGMAPEEIGGQFIVHGLRLLFDDLDRPTAGQLGVHVIIYAYEFMRDRKIAKAQADGAPEHEIEMLREICAGTSQRLRSMLDSAERTPK